MGSDGGRVTWSLSLAGLTYGAGFTTSQFEAAAQAAFDAWESYVDIDFEYAVGDADIDVVTRTLSGSTVGLATYSFGTGPVSGNDVAIIQEATIDMDLEPTWSPNGENGQLNYYAVLLHEIGHAIGLDHVDDSTEIMNTPLTADDLGDGDIAGAQVLYGGSNFTPGDDVVDLSADTVAATLYLLAGNDVVTATTLADTIYGGAGNDTVNGLGGDDRLIDVIGANDLNGGAGDDLIIVSGDGSTGSGDADDDILLGGSGDDALDGGAGNDTIIGDSGSRFFFGNDVISAGTGTDFLQGGGGADTFVFLPGDGLNTIGKLAFDVDDPAATTLQAADFQSGVDLIDLRAFSYDTAADAFAQVSDVGNVAHFSDLGTTIIFHDLEKSDLQMEDFWV